MTATGPARRGVIHVHSLWSNAHGPRSIQRRAGHFPTGENRSSRRQHRRGFRFLPARKGGGGTEAARACRHTPTRKQMRWFRSDNSVRKEDKDTLSHVPSTKLIPTQPLYLHITAGETPAPPSHPHTHTHTAGETTASPSPTHTQQRGGDPRTPLAHHDSDPPRHDDSEPPRLGQPIDLCECLQQVHLQVAEEKLHPSLRMCESQFQTGNESGQFQTRNHTSLSA